MQCTSSSQQYTVAAVVASLLLHFPLCVLNATYTVQTLLGNTVVNLGLMLKPVLNTIIIFLAILIQK